VDRSFMFTNRHVMVYNGVGPILERLRVRD
jgi:hypothetical protein